MNINFWTAGKLSALVAVSALMGTAAVAAPTAPVALSHISAPAQISLAPGLRPSLMDDATNEKLDFKLINDTDFKIKEIFITPTSQDDWADDTLDKELDPKDEADITFDAKETADLWDLKITDEDGKSYEWYKLDLPKITTLTIKWEDGKGEDDETDK